MGHANQTLEYAVGQTNQWQWEPFDDASTINILSNGSHQQNGDVNQQQKVDTVEKGYHTDSQQSNTGLSSNGAHPRL